MADPLVQEVQRLVSAWLEQDEGHLRQLVDWLQGFGLPSARYDDEPFQWLLRGIPLGADRHHSELEVARRAAALLNERPDVSPVGRRPNEVLFNLLELCAGLGVPDHLADPLYDMFERHALAGHWRGVDLRIPLRQALIANQKDSRLGPVWQSMLLGENHSWLLGDYYDGFEGVRLQPKSADTRGEPNLDAIGHALVAMTRHVGDCIDSRAEFRRLVDRVIATYPGRPSWHADLIELADKNKFPTWAVSALPSLFVRLPPMQNRSQAESHYFMWNVIAPILRRLNESFSVERRLCDEGIVLEVYMSKAAEKKITRASAALECRRVSNPYKTYRVVVQSAYEALIRENGTAKAEGKTHEETQETDKLLSREEMAIYRESIIQDKPEVLSAAAG